MALQFILGSSGSGKTEWLYDRLLETAETEKKNMIYLIVPEQFTLQAQKGIVARQKHGAILNIDVVSFQRLAYRIFDELGLDDLTVLEDTGKSLILRRLAEEHKNELKVLKNQIHRMGYIEQVKSLISEFMQYDISPERLETYLDGQPESAFTYKLRDVLVLYRAFEAYIKGNYVTAEQLLTVLADCVPASALLKDAILAFDGFTGFTPVQTALLKPLFSVSSQVYVTVTVDADVRADGKELSGFYALGEIERDRGMQELFYMSRKMIRSVSRAAEEGGCPVQAPVCLCPATHDGTEISFPNEGPARDEGSAWNEGSARDAGSGRKNPSGVQKKSAGDGGKKTRFSENPPLQFLEQHLFRSEPACAYVSEEAGGEESAFAGSKSACEPGRIGSAEGKSSGFPGSKSAPEVISLSSLASPKEELTFAASKIRELVQGGAYRYQEIAVVSGNEALYQTYAADILGLYEIPYFSDHKESVYYHPFTEWVRALLELVQKDFSYECVFRYLRTGLCGFSAEEIDLLDNYVRDRGIFRYKKWKEKWVRPPRLTGRGVTRPEGEEIGQLTRLNSLRERFLAQVRPLYETAEKKDVRVRELTQAVYDVMVSLDIQRQLKHMQEQYENQRLETKAAACAQIYRIVIDLLDKVVDLLGEEMLPVKEYAQILDAGFRAARVGVVPPGADCVMLGDIERTRLDGIRVLFFLGVNDGVIPKAQERKALLSDYEREHMKADQIELAPAAREEVFLQRFYLYLNLTKPSEKLYLTCARMGADGKGQKPSYLFRTIRQLFPELTVSEYAAGRAAAAMTARSSTLDYLHGLAAAGEGNLTEEWMNLSAWRMRQPDLKAETERLFEAAFAAYDGERLNAELATELYGTVLTQSVTRLEQFSRCAYAHFLTYGLRLGERPEYGFEAVDLGTVCHDTLAAYSRKMEEQGLSWFTITEEEQQRVLGEAMEDTLLSMDTSVFTDSARSRSMLACITDILSDNVRVLTDQVRKGDFVPADYEVSFHFEVPLARDGGEGEQSPQDCTAAAVKTGPERKGSESGRAETGKMVVTGRIDRMDLYEEDGRLYVKILDYKSGKHTFRLQEFHDGLGLQLVTYLPGAEAYLERRFPGVEKIPAGVLYYHLDRPVVDGDEGSSPQETEQKIFEALRPEGLVNSDAEIISHLDKTIVSKTGKSDVIPIRLLKDGSVSGSASSAADGEQFRWLTGYVVKKIRESGQEILSGEIAAEPVQTKDTDGCTYCPYHGVCGFDPRLPGYRHREMPQFDDDELWKKIQGKAENG